MSYDRTNINILRKEEKMFKNIGSKIKNVAEFFTWIGIIVSIIVFLISISMGSDESIAIGFIILIIGCLGSWLSSLVLYGFGQLVENSDVMAGKRTSSRLSEVNENSYKNDPYYKASEPDERTFEQVVENANLSNEQKNRIKELRKLLDDDLIDLTDCCKRIRQIAQNQPEEFIIKLIAKL